MNDSLFNALNPVAVKTQELNILPLLSDDLFVERDSVFPSAFLGATLKDVIDIKDTFVSNAAFSAGSAKVFDSSISSGSVTVVPASTRQFANTVRIVLFPLLHASSAALVYALRTATIALPARRATVNTFICRFAHIEKRITGKGRREPRASL